MKGRRLSFVVVAALAAQVALAGCAGEDVFTSVVEGDAQLAPGPTFLLDRLDRRPGLAHTPEGEFALRDFVTAGWSSNGSLVVLGADALSLRAPDGEVLVDDRLRRADAGLRGDQLRVSGGEVAFLSYDDPLSIDVWSSDLDEHRQITVPTDAVETDQIGEDAPLSLHGSPFTLGGATWVEWGINSEDDTLTDHGVLRITGRGDDLEIAEAQRNEPVVRLYPSHDGAALLMLRQDNGDSLDCGGCIVAQEIVELDPATGEVAGEYGMPPGYDKNWRVDAVDKVDGTVAVRFARQTNGGVVAWQLWSFDGEWSHHDEYDGTRTTWQNGGRLVQTTAREGESTQPQAPYTLRWIARDLADDDAELLFEPSQQTCRLDSGEPMCPELVVPGALLAPE